MMKSVYAVVPFLFITLGQGLWAAPSREAAQSHVLRSTNNQRHAAEGKVRNRNRAQRHIPSPVSFRVAHDRGLLADTWINGSGPYTFAIDTGAGATIISERIATAADISILSGRPISLAGLSGRPEHSAHAGTIKSLALGRAENLLPRNPSVIISDGLPSDIDGILDPTEAYAPLGYVIDIPNHELGAFDCTLNPLSARNPPADGAVVQWVMRRGSRRPFVNLEDGRQVLLDTGSALGLAVAQNPSVYDRREGRRVADIGGGSVTSRSSGPATVSIGALTLRRVPTDVLSGVEKGAPTLLGRAALYPFRLAFDPIHRLIAISPAQR